MTMIGANPLAIRDVTVTDEFWRSEQELVRKEVIPYQWEALNDRIDDAEPSYVMHNFKAAAEAARRGNGSGVERMEPEYTPRGGQIKPKDPRNPAPDRFYGCVFQDSDFSKWIEAVGYSLANHPDPDLERTADEAIDIVCAAQLDNGYLDTCFILNGMDRHFTNLRGNHELYCMGHLIEGAVAYWEGTGKRKLLDAAARFADYACSFFGPGENQSHGYPGHPEAELALMKLFRATGERRYLELAKYFVDQRGTEPNYFHEEAEHARAMGWPDGNYEPDPTYYQAQAPVREQATAVGHAVRATYLYAGMADVARETGDETLANACRTIWHDIVSRKLYVTGAIGDNNHGESFSYGYDLKNDMAYAETCAACSLAMFARRMLQIEPKAEYADVMERALANTMLGGMDLDGRGFFYVNPLEINPRTCVLDSHQRTWVKPRRQRWFDCACCPPNLSRTVSSIQQYAYTATDDTLWFHMYLGGTVRHAFAGGRLELGVDANVPFQDGVEVRIGAETPVRATLAFRMPQWTDRRTASIETNAANVVREERDGYVYLTAEWKSGDVIALHLPMPVRMLAANPRVKEDFGKVAFQRGPFVYAAEEADNGRDLHLLEVDLDRVGAHAEGVAVCDWHALGRPLHMLEVPGVRHTAPQDDAAPLYADYAEVRDRDQVEEAAIRLIPYFAWDNRELGEMCVWLNARRPR